jgi:hypothetical protein
VADERWANQMKKAESYRHGHCMETGKLSFYGLKKGFSLYFQKASETSKRTSRG